MVENFFWEVRQDHAFYNEKCGAWFVGRYFEHPKGLGLFVRGWGGSYRLEFFWRGVKKYPCADGKYPGAFRKPGNLFAGGSSFSFALFYNSLRRQGHPFSGLRKQLGADPICWKVGPLFNLAV